MSKFKIAAALGCALALCFALAGCGGGSSSSSSGSSSDASSGSSEAVESSSSAASSASESSSAAASSSSAASSASADYTAGNGTLDCEYVTIEVTGQDVWDHADGTKGTRLLLHIVNKTDQEINLDTGGAWDVNGNVAYGVVMEGPAPGGEVDTWRSGPTRTRAP